MRVRADLHVHTTASDGRLTPSAIVELAVRRGVSVLAITDHDSTEGVPEAVVAARSHQGLLVLPGVEINTDVPGAEVHVLGYCMDSDDEEMCGTLKRLRGERRDRGRKMVARLAEIGVNISWDRVQHFAGEGAVGRPHVAQAILEAGYVKSFGEAFDRYIGRNGPAYVERDKITPEDAVRLIRRAGGFAVLAHPHSFGLERLGQMLGPLVAAGLAGIEVYYDNLSGEGVRWLAEMGVERKLVLTGGSDFHGLAGENETQLGDVDIPSQHLDAFLSLVGKHSPKLLTAWSLTLTK